MSAGSLRRVPTVLAIDVGNTSTSFALVRGKRVVRPSRLPSCESSPAQIRAALQTVAGKESVQSVVAASVVPSAVAPWTNAVRRVLGLGVHWVSHRSPLGVPISYPQPKSIGADRLANAAGAVARYGAPVVVADFGTALTFDIVGQTEGYRGGIIAPGLPLMFGYLADRTALLPRIGPGPVRGVVGRSTEQAMRIGATLGYRGMIREIFEALREEIDDPALTFVVTGGDARWVVRQLRMEIVLDPYLTLFGLARIGELLQRS